MRSFYVVMLYLLRQPSLFFCLTNQKRFFILPKPASSEKSLPLKRRLTLSYFWLPTAPMCFKASLMLPQSICES